MNETEIERLTRERDEARLLVTEANNSLYGSQGYFHSLNGGEFDKYHLASGIERAKSYGREQWRRAEAAEAKVAMLLEALDEITQMTASQIGFPLDTEAASEHARIAAGMSEVARAALSKAQGD